MWYIICIDQHFWILRIMIVSTPSSNEVVAMMVRNPVILSQVNKCILSNGENLETLRVGTTYLLTEIHDQG